MLLGSELFGSEYNKSSFLLEFMFDEGVNKADDSTLYVQAKSI